MTICHKNTPSASGSNTYSNSHNKNINQISFESTVEQSKQSISQALDESKRNINRNLDESQNQIPRYSQEITNTQEQITQDTREIYANVLEYNKHAISSFQSAFAPYFENIQNQFWGNRELFRRVPEIYSRIVSNFTENTIAMNRFFNDIMFSNIRLYKNAVNNAKGYSSHQAEMGKRSAQMYEGIKRSIRAGANGTPFSINNNNNNNYQRYNSINWLNFNPFHLFYLDRGNVLL